MLSDPIQRDRVQRILQKFRISENILYYEDTVCVPGSQIRELIHLAHVSTVSGHLYTSKTLSCLDQFNWKHKSRDSWQYFDGCSTFQEQKDGSRKRKKLGTPRPLDIHERIWGSVSTDFITKFRRTSPDLDSIQAYVDRFSRRVHVVAWWATDSAVQVADTLFLEIFRRHGIPHMAVRDYEPNVGKLLTLLLLSASARLGPSPYWFIIFLQLCPHRFYWRINFWDLSWMVL